MKQFILAALASLSLVLLSITGLYRIKRPAQAVKIDQIEETLEVVSLGTSHVWNIDFSNSELNGMIFGFGGNTVFYDLQNYRYLQKKGHLGEDVIILVQLSYFAFGVDENRSDGQVGKAFVDQFYHYLPPWRIYDYSLSHDLKLITHRTQGNFHSLWKGKKKGAASPSFKSVHKNVKNTSGIEDSAPDVKALILERHSRGRAKNHRILCDFRPEDQNLAYLDLLLQEIRDNGHRAILVTTPYYHAYNEFMDIDWLEENYFPKVRQLAKSHNLHYLNYGMDDRFTLDPNFYHDCDHLNHRGKKAFNKVFFEDFRNLTNPTAVTP